MRIVKCVHCGNDTPDNIGVCLRCGEPWDKSWDEVIKEENARKSQSESKEEENG